ncbi:MAG: DUF262 domain-containing protein [Hyphomonadaceae bacterium]|nr:MAG: hypothetical protein FD160_523 [Caulobacteraceae bacterium]MBT9446884.1 DUF262 domain-containing protein [Hyphomonadaceae bacterium]TPW05750.1 MAG: hypothetical protein FD124_2028 [Alphaproteobacteria bacterium]
MRHTIEAGEKRLNDVFCDSYAFSIPAYQRPYAWTTEQAGELISDILDAVSAQPNTPVTEMDPYFLGSIVLIKHPDHPDAQVVDGQQRLTTLTILLATLRDLSEGNLQVQLDKRVREAGDVLSNTKDRYRLTTRERDAEFFQMRVQSQGATLNISPAYGDSDPRKRIAENTLLLRDRLSEMTSEERQRFAQYLMLRCYMVMVSASDEEAAYRIFSVMNARGLDLSPTDILKAQVIGAIEAADRDDYTETWEAIEEQLGRERFTELFGHIRTIYRPQKMKESLVKEFREYVKPLAAPKDFIDSTLSPYAQSFEVIVNRRFLAPKRAEEVNLWLLRLQRLDNADWLPPAIRFLSDHKDQPDEVAEFLRQLERLAYALFITRADVNARNRRYAAVFEAMGSSAPSALSSVLALSDADRKSVLTELDGPLYENPRTRLPVLLRLDEMVADSGAVYDHKTVTVEHVLPQSPARESDWCTAFPEKRLRDEWVHRVANLVLLSRKKNAQAQNYDFSKKKEKYFMVKEVSPFALTSQVLSEMTWTPEVLQRRQEMLLAKFASEWDLSPTS